MLLSIFLSPHNEKKNQKKIVERNPKQYITVRRGHRDIQKIAKDWLRKFKK
jgi:hypothetical protein